MSSGGEDLTAHLASSLDPMDVDAYAQFAIRTRSPLAREVLREAGETAALGRVVALGATPDAHERGLEILDAAVARGGTDSLPGPALTLRAELLLRAGRDEELRALLEDTDSALPDATRWMLRTDLANPHRRTTSAGGSGAEDLTAAEGRWLETFNEVHSADGLEPVRLRPATPDATPYQRLEAPTGDRVDGELVSVVMSAYHPDRDLLLAARGVLDQTWQNLELLVVDDASGPGSAAVLDEVEALDPRVRVVRAPRNGGTYEARNLALTIARGRWMTFQDSDDWTHPRRVEHQVRHLLEFPKVLGNRTWTLRAYPDLTMTFVGYPASRMNASSLLFDRPQVTRLVGGFDSTRKTGDMELPFRLRAIRPGSVRDLYHPSPLAITQLRTGSLSRDDALPGWIRWDRLAYRDSYLEWHQQLAKGRLDPVLPRPTGRAFPLPRRAWYPDREEAPAQTAWDVVVLGDLRPDGAGSHRSLAVARAAADGGLRTAIAHAESPRPLTAKRVELLPEMSTDVRLGHLGVTNAHEEDEVDLLVVTRAESLLHLDAAGLRVRSVLVVTDEASPRGWSVAAVDEHCRALLGVDPLWGGPARVHGAPAVPSAVRTAVPEDRWHTVDLPALPGTEDVAVGSPSLPRPLHRRALDGSPVRPMVVVGHDLPDFPRRWPGGADALADAYPERVRLPGRDGDEPDTVPVEVHALHRLTSVTTALDRRLPPPAWVSFAGTGMTRRELLSHLDVWAYFGEWDDKARIAALRALDAGLPCLLGEEAAESGLGGPVRCVPPERAREALEDLLAHEVASAPEPTDPRQAWQRTLHDLHTTTDRRGTHHS